MDQPQSCLAQLGHCGLRKLALFWPTVSQLGFGFLGCLSKETLASAACWEQAAPRRLRATKRLRCLEFLCKHSLLSSLIIPTQVTRTLMITYVPKDIEDPEIIIKHFQ